MSFAAKWENTTRYNINEVSQTDTERLIANVLSFVYKLKRIALELEWRLLEVRKRMEGKRRLELISAHCIQACKHHAEY